MADFDWVKAMQDCSIREAFERLRGAVEKDVRLRNDLRRPDDAFVLKFLPRPPDAFVVMREGPVSLNASTVRFTLDAGEIQIASDEGDVDLVVTVTLNPLGDCRYVVNNQDLPDWYIRKLALAKCFFGRMFG